MPGGVSWLVSIPQWRKQTVRCRERVSVEFLAVQTDRDARSNLYPAAAGSSASIDLVLAVWSSARILGKVRDCGLRNFQTNPVMHVKRSCAYMRWATLTMWAEPLRGHDRCDIQEHRTATQQLPVRLGVDGRVHREVHHTACRGARENGLRANHARQFIQT